MVTRRSVHGLVSICHSTASTHYSSGALIPECNRLSKFKEDTDGPYVPVWEINLIAYLPLVQPTGNLPNLDLNPGRCSRQWVRPTRHSGLESGLVHWATDTGNESPLSVVYFSISLSLRSGRGAEYCDQTSICLRVCLSVCVCLSTSISLEPMCRKFCLRIPCGQGSVLLWQCGATLCTFGFMDDVTFGRNGRDAETWRLHRAATAMRGVAIHFYCFIILFIFVSVWTYFVL